MKELTPQLRQQIENVIIKTYDEADKTGANSQYYKELFSKLNDAKFFKLVKQKLPWRFHTEVFKVEPSMSDVFDAFKVLNKPLTEKVKLNYLYKNKDGEAIESKECLVIYINVMRMKQMRIKKTNTAIEIAKRGMHDGRLLSDDKGGLQSNKEFEAAAALGLENTIIENARVKADAMKAKTEAYNNINVKGEVSFEDIDADRTDSIAKNTFNVYLIGCNLHSNLVDQDYYTPHTLNKRKRQMRDS